MTDLPTDVEAPQRRRPLRSWRLSRRAVAKSMISVGVAGIITAVIGLIVGVLLVGQVESSVDDSLLLTNEALVAVDDSITVTASIVEAVRDGMASVETTMATVRTSLDQTSTAISDSAEFLGGSLPDALDAVNAVLPTIEGAASSVDTALEVLSNAPFGPDYDPVQPLNESVADLAAALDPIPAELRTLSDDFADLTDATSSISRDVGRLGLEVAGLAAQLDSVATLLDRYTSTTESAQVLAEASREDLEQSASVTRWLLVLLAAVYAGGQIVPIWLGFTLLKDDGAPVSIVARTATNE